MKVTETDTVGHMPHKAPCWVRRKYFLNLSTLSRVNRDLQLQEMRLVMIFQENRHNDDHDDGGGWSLG